MNKIEDIQKLFEPYIDLPLECDGLTRVLSYVLKLNGIEHTIMFGSIAGTVHFWIEFEDTHIVDYRARMWMGDTEDIPHGIFTREEYPDADWYDTGKETGMVTSKFHFDILTTNYHEL